MPNDVQLAPQPPLLTAAELRTMIEALTTVTGTLQTALDRMEGKEAG